MLTQKQFDLLVFLSEEKSAPEISAVASKLGISEEAAEAIVCELAEKKLIEDGKISARGYSALEPYRVKRAIFMAAGFGSRMIPITLNVPKPLVKVHGKRMIDTLLDAVIAAEIEEIYVIRGHLGEQFDQLLDKYPMIRFIENPFYDEGNNIVSVACAGTLIKNAYVLEADLVLSNPKLIQKYQYRSNYLGIPVKQTDDWCVHTENGIITKVAQGGENCHQVVGISYWTEYDGSRLVGQIKEVIHSPGGKNLLWGQVPLVRYKDQYAVAVRDCSKEDVVEIDSFTELKMIDSSYDI